MVVKSNKKGQKIVTSWSVGLTEEEHRIVVQYGIKPKKIRSYLRNLAKQEKDDRLATKWQDIKQKLDLINEKDDNRGWLHPVLQVVGRQGAGKSTMIKNLIENSPEYVFVVLDTHNEHKYLQTVHVIHPELKESCRFAVTTPLAAEMWFKTLTGQLKSAQNSDADQTMRFPKNFILLIEEAMEYQPEDLERIMVQSRKFIRIMIVSQRLLFDYMDHVQIKPYYS